MKQLVINQIDKKLKDLRTLKQHYYPEGGWGWVILLVSMSVQAIVQGAQIGLAMYLVGGAGRAPYVVGVTAAGGPKGGGVTSYSTRAALLLAKRIVAGKEQDTSKGLFNITQYLVHCNDSL